MSGAGRDTGNRSPRLRPEIYWKYGWNDGNLANLTGSAKGGDLRPLGVPYLPAGGYTPADIIHAYGYDQIHSSGGTGSNTTIAIVVAFGCPENTLRSDLDDFCSYFGISTCTPTVVYPTGKPEVDDSGWAGETMMDVEWAHALAPDANLLVVVSQDDLDANLNQCIQYASTNADVVSMSWGGPEDPSDPLNHFLFTNTGVSFVAASGDSGKEVDWPPSDPNVLAVGGTSLLLSWNKTIGSETAWGGSSGGISKYQPFPSYQAGWSSVNSGRQIPDVSFLADPYTGVYVYNTDPITGEAGWSINGGTSIACPMWASLLACRSSLAGSPNGFLHPLLYGSASIPGKSNRNEISSSVFRDITHRQPRYPNDPYQAFSPTQGYDLATGIGSPVTAAVAALSPSSTSPVSVNFPAIEPVTYSPGLRVRLDANSSRGNLPIRFTSSKPAVAAVEGNSLLIRGAGTTSITAGIPGRSVAPVSRTLVVERAPVSPTTGNPSSVPHQNGILPSPAVSAPSVPTHQ